MFGNEVAMEDPDHAKEYTRSVHTETATWSSYSLRQHQRYHHRDNPKATYDQEHVPWLFQEFELPLQLLEVSLHSPRRLEHPHRCRTIHPEVCPPLSTAVHPIVADQYLRFPTFRVHPIPKQLAPHEWQRSRVWYLELFRYSIWGMISLKPHKFPCWTDQQGIEECSFCTWGYYDSSEYDEESNQLLSEPFRNWKSIQSERRHDHLSIPPWYLCNMFWPASNLCKPCKLEHHVEYQVPKLSWSNLEHKIWPMNMIRYDLILRVMDKELDFVDIDFENPLRILMVRWLNLLEGNLKQFLMLVKYRYCFLMLNEHLFHESIELVKQ